MLPTVGLSKWTIRVGPSGVDVRRTFVGVACDVGRDQSVWALNVGEGKTVQLGVNPPEGWPDCPKIAVKSDGHNITPSPRGWVDVQVHLNHDDGTLGFSVDRGACHVVFRDFPAGAQLRPWAMVGHGFSAMDHEGTIGMVTFDPPYLQ